MTISTPNSQTDGTPIDLSSRRTVLPFQRSRISTARAISPVDRQALMRRERAASFSAFVVVFLLVAGVLSLVFGVGPFN